MKDLTKEWPRWPLGAQDYTVIDLGHWQWCWAKEQDMLAWLEALDHPSWFAWERPRRQMIFGDHDVATLFALRWS